MLRGCTTIRHVIEIQFSCPTKNKKVRQVIDNPYIGQGNHYSDWSYNYISFKCKTCDKSHKFEL